MSLSRAVCGLVVIALVSTTCANAQAPESRGAYVAAFGGGGGFHINNVNQNGTALFPPSKGGPLLVDAGGEADSQPVGIVGLQIGRQGSGFGLGMDGSGWALLPAAEFEGFYLGGTQHARVTDTTNRLGGHVFDDTFPIDSGAFLTNAVFSLQTPSAILTPYVGVGVGAACVSINGADSPQIIPPEPGVNHFNSNPSSSSWGFAAQTKVGLRILLTERIYLFTEYRLLYVSSTNYTFGSTVFPGHAPTSPWTVHFGDIFHHLGVGGIGFNF